VALTVRGDAVEPEGTRRGPSPWPSLRSVTVPTSFDPAGSALIPSIRTELARCRAPCLRRAAVARHRGVEHHRQRRARRHGQLAVLGRRRGRRHGAVSGAASAPAAAAAAPAAAGCAGCGAGAAGGAGDTEQASVSACWPPGPGHRRARRQVRRCHRRCRLGRCGGGRTAGVGAARGRLGRRACATGAAFRGGAWRHAATPAMHIAAVTVASHCVFIPDPLLDRTLIVAPRRAAPARRARRRRWSPGHGGQWSGGTTGRPYSYRRASIGSRREALIAGQTPLTRPVKPRIRSRRAGCRSRGAGGCRFRPRVARTACPRTGGGPASVTTPHEMRIPSRPPRKVIARASSRTGAGSAGGAPQCLAQPDLPRPLVDRDEHDVHHAHPADQQRSAHDEPEHQQQARRHPLSASWFPRGHS